MCKLKPFLGAAPRAFTVHSLGLLCAESGKLTGRVDRDYAAGKPDLKYPSHSDPLRRKSALDKLLQDFDSDKFASQGAVQRLVSNYNTECISYSGNKVSHKHTSPQTHSASKDYLECFC